MKLPGFAWANQAAMDFQIPPEAGLHWIIIGVRLTEL